MFILRQCRSVEENLSVFYQTFYMEVLHSKTTLMLISLFCIQRKTNKNINYVDSGKLMVLKKLTNLYRLDNCTHKLVFLGDTFRLHATFFDPRVKLEHKNIIYYQSDNRLFWQFKKASEFVAQNTSRKI